MLKNIGLLLFSLFLSSTVFAYETAKVLPKKGISRFRLVSVFSEPIFQTYNSDGRLELTTESLNQTLTLQSALQTASPEKKARVNQLVNTLNTLDPGLGDHVLNSTTQFSADFELNVQTYVPAYEYALTNRLSLGLRIPIVKRSFDISLTAQGQDHTQLAQQRVGALSSQLSNGLRELSQSFPTNSATYIAQFTNKGYQAPQDFEDTALGDTELGAKWNFYQKGDSYLTTQFGIRLPTGSTGELDNLFDRGTGGGAWGLALSFFQEHQLLNNLWISGMQDIKYFLPDSRDRIIPLDEHDSLPDLNNDQIKYTTRTQSPIFELQLGATYYMFDKSFYLSNSYVYKTQDSAQYSGTGDLYYKGLEENTDIKSFTADIGIGYSSIPAFKQKKFSIPLELRAKYYTTLSGENIPLVSYIRTELLVYF